ncbi:MAG: nuclease domain-containing protein [Ghiorsea sp.]
MKVSVIKEKLPEMLARLAEGKSTQECACFACFDCHEVLDGRVKYAWDDVVSKEWYMRKAQIRTMRIWFEEGLIGVKG